MATGTRTPHEPDYDKNPAQDEFDRLIKRNFNPSDGRAAEDREAATDDIKGGDSPRAESPLNQSSHADKKESNLLGQAGSDGSLYKKYGSIKSWRDKKKLLFGIGLGGTALIAGLIALFGFLNVFKLDHLMSNIDARTFARVNGSLDQRSTKYIQTYMRLRLADIGNNPNLNVDDPDNLIFRANKVRMDDPIYAWYRILRVSKFENEVFEKNGIKFTSVAYRDGNQIKFRPAKIVYNGKDFFGDPIPDDKQQEIRRALTSGDWSRVNTDDFIGKYLYQSEFFDSDKEGRRAIKQYVKDNTHWSQVFIRRHIRKSIQNMTGVRDWRFFEDKRNKFDEKKIDIRNKIIAKAVPQSTLSGKFVTCLFGISDCTFNRDPAAPSNRAEGVIPGSEVAKEGKDLNQYDEDRNPVPAQSRDKVNLSPAADAVKQISGSILSKANVALLAADIVATLDAMSNVHSAISDHRISKSVTVARGVQAMGLYQTFGTARDQMKAGDVQAAEVNEMMKVLGPISASEGWARAIEGKDIKSSSMTKRQYCDERHQSELEKDIAKANQEFAYLCDSKQIGGGTNAATLEKSYTESVGKILGPILDAYKGVRDSPVFGNLLGALSAISEKFSQAIGVVVKTTLAAFGLSDNVDQLMQKLVIKVAGFLGAGPIMTGDEPAGVYTNWLVQGGAYTAEATARMNGGRLTTSADKRLAEANASRYEADKIAGLSIFERYLSLSNPESAASTGAFAVSNLKFSTVTDTFISFKSSFGYIISVLGSTFTGSADAQTFSGYQAAELAGIPTYDFPAECLDLDPLKTSPQGGTNIQKVLADKNIPDSELTWELLTDSDEWYGYLYEKLADSENADETAEKVYNCHLLDTSVRGSLGFLYGYTDDNGLGELLPSASSQQSTSAGVPADVQQLAKEILANSRISYWITDSGDTRAVVKALSEGKRAFTTSSDANAVANREVDINPSILRFILEVAKDSPIMVNALTDKDHSANSNHYKGQAIDINCGPSAEILDRAASKHGGRDNGERCDKGFNHWHYDF